MIKKFLALFLIGMVIMCSFTVQAVESKKDKIKYAALGDSIATGYALPDYAKNDGSEEAYTTLVKNYLGEVFECETEYCLFATDGLTTDGLYKKLKNKPETIKGADIITVSIGSNDLLNVFNGIINKYLINNDLSAVLDEENTESAASALEQLNNLKNEFTDNSELNAVCEAYPSKISNLYALIKEISPNAKVYFTNIYNPFKKSSLFGFDVFSLADPYIAKMNRAFDLNADYRVADIYTAFTNSVFGVTNIQDDFKSFDPHPNSKGHKLIFEKVAELISSDNSKIHKVLETFVNSDKNSAVFFENKTENLKDTELSEEVSNTEQGDSVGLLAVKFIGRLLTAAEIFKFVF